MINQHLDKIKSEFNKLQVERNFLADRFKSLPVKFNRWIFIKGYRLSESLSDGKNIIYTHKFKSNETLEKLWRQFELENDMI